LLALSSAISLMVVGAGDWSRDLVEPNDNTKGGAVTDDLPEVMVGADLLLQVDLLLGQSIFQFGYLPIGLRVFHRNRDLLRNLAEQLDVFRAVVVFARSQRQTSLETRSRRPSFYRAHHPECYALARRRASRALLC
jgi:hypothetical protein